MATPFARLKRHPFPVEAFFERAVAVSFAFKRDDLQALVPAPLEVDAYDDFGFVTVALVWTRALRLAGLPKWTGQDFFLAGYRVFVRMREADGRRLRGLKILRSETDKGRMVFLGNLLTHYAYRKVQVEESEREGVCRVVTRRPDGQVTLALSFDLGTAPDAPPPGSPFPDWQTARGFAGPMPFTFDHEGGGRFVVIEGKRTQWTPVPVRVLAWQVALFGEPDFPAKAPVLANAFRVDGVPYRWERGRLVTPRPMGEANDE